MTGKDVYLQMTWSWPDKTWNILCSYCLQWNTSQSKFRNHYFLFLFAFSILSQLFLIWGCIFQFIWMDAQCSCIWRTVNCSVKRTTRRSFVALTHTHTHACARAQRKIQSERVFHNMQNWCATCKRYSLLCFPVTITEFLWNSSAFKNCRVRR